MPIEVRVFCKTFVKALNIAILLSMISLVARELGLKKTALEKRRREFSGIPAELIRYADAVDIVTKLAYYKQRVSNNAMISQIVPITDEICQ